jgi:hypothetical protein
MVSELVTTLFVLEMMSSRESDVWNIQFALFFSIVDTFLTDNEINPGFYTHINQRGLQLVGDYVHDRVVRFLRSDVTYNFSGQLTSEVQFSLAGLRIRQFDEQAFQSTISLLPGVGIIWKVWTS